jgi:hypothetical protein
LYTRDSVYKTLADQMTFCFIFNSQGYSQKPNSNESVMIFMFKIMSPYSVSNLYVNSRVNKTDKKI